MHTQRLTRSTYCPGMSHDTAGRLFVTGGNNAEVTSIYDFPSATWTKGPDMKHARGYHASTITSEGNIFTIGGSFSGDIGGENNVLLKDGEVFRQNTGTWDLLPGALVQPMLTRDVQGAYRSDNHDWLHTWLHGWVLQAGPSTNMNWYDTKAQGEIQPAGTRTAGFDQMNRVVSKINRVAYDEARY
jgi:galactose oxidase